MSLQKSKIVLFALILLLTNDSLRAQKFEGIATYQTATKLHFSMDSTLETTVDQEAIQAQLSKAMQKEFTMHFDQSESTYSEAESLGGAPKVSTGGVNVKVLGGGGITYRDVKSKIEIESTDLFGKPFLIEDTPVSHDWQIKNEFKQIGNYECQKATFVREIKESTVLSDSQSALNTSVKKVEVEAWFTKEIPINHGPDQYWGLPGLILEVNNGTTTIVCSKVVLNPTESVTIKRPKGGKTITRSDYETLREKKTEEMMKQYRGSEEGMIRIKVGG